MSVRRPQRDCVLCMSSFDEDLHRAVFHARQEAATLEEAVARIAKLGIEVSADELRLHIQYHRPLQPAPRTRFRPEEALARAKRLPERQRSLLLLVSRVPALSGTQLAELFYWNGQSAQLASARAACYRDLTKLVRGNFLYRWYPPVATGPAGTKVRAWQHRLSFYFLGRDASPLVAEVDQYELIRGRDWFASPDELADTHDLFAASAAAEAIVSLSRQAQAGLAAGQTVATALGPAELQLDRASWYGAWRLAFPSRAKGPTISGLASFALRVPGQSSLLSPFLYEYDDGLRPLAEMSEQVLRYIDLKRSGAVGARFPELRKARVFPPVLAVAADPFRLESLRRSVQAAAKRRGATSELPIIICSDQSTVHGVGLAEAAWVSAWDAQPSPRHYRLPDVLIHQAAQLEGVGLDGSGPLVFSPDAPMPQLVALKEPLDERQESEA